MKFSIILNIIFILLIFNSTDLHSQERVTIEFNNGETIRGVAKIKGSSKIVFSEKYKGEKVNYDYNNDIKRVVLKRGSPGAGAV